MSFTTLAEGAAMPLADTASRRRHSWILPNLRGRMGLWLVAAPALVATTATWAALFVLWSPILDRVVWSIRGANPDGVFWDVCLRIFLTTGTLAVIFGIVALVAARIVSHRVAGPLHRMGEVAEQVTKGRHHERVRLRDGDYIEDFAEKFNDMLDCVEARSRFHRNRMRAVQKNLSDLETALANGTVSAKDVENRLRESLRIVQDARVGNPEEETPVLY
jgi:methyl-accepting chemotaxis protein